jgi:hypothetical protein
MKSKLKKKRTLLLTLLLSLLLGTVIFLFFRVNSGTVATKKTAVTPTPTTIPAAVIYSGETDNNLMGGDFPIYAPTTAVLGASTQRTTGNGNSGGNSGYMPYRPRNNTPVPTRNPLYSPTPTSTPTPTLMPGVSVTPTLGIPSPGVNLANFTRRLKLNQNLKGTLYANDQIDVESIGTTGNKEIILKFKNGSYANIPLAEVNADFSVDRDWSAVNSGISKYKDRAFIHGLVEQAGAGATYTLYVPIPAGRVSNQVVICPGALSLDQVQEKCNNELKFSLNQTIGISTATQITNSYGTFWKVTGLSGTGGLSLLEPFDLSDTLTRLQISQASNHYIQLGTINGLLSPTDTLEVQLGSAWNFGALSVNDIDLLDDGVNVTLANSPGVNTWGVAINNGTGLITFTAPASGTGYIAAASLMQIKIGTNAVSGTTGTVQITNPDTVSPYNVSLLITNAEGTEEAIIVVPIIASDQVTVTSFINTFITFDIDTAINVATNCNFDTCLTHENGAVGSNYTVDLGELNASAVNISNGAAVIHSQGGSGKINSIFFDLTTNAVSGAIVTVTSANGALVGPGTSKIDSVATNGAGITANSGLYGFTLPNTTSGNGTINRNSSCATNSTFCRLITGGTTVFDTNSSPLDNGRIRMDIAAAAIYTNNPGVYTDTLTFSAVATY